MDYQIGDFSKIAQVSIKTLRYYHEYGILIPTRVDSTTGYRYYTDTDLDKSRIISILKEFDFTLKEIKEILATYTEDSEITDFMNNKLKEIRDKISNYTEIEQKLHFFIKQEERLKMIKYSYDIVIKDVPDILMASIRYKGKYSDTGIYIGMLFKQGGKYMKGNIFNLYHDADYKEEDADIETCVEVRKEFNTATVKTKTLKGGKAVTLIHKGSYETIGTSYKKLIDFISKNNIKTILPSREIYIKGPGAIFRGNPKNYLTELQIFLGD